MELIGLRIDRRYLPLAEGIVERVVNVLRSDAKPARRVAVDIDHQPEAVVLLIARDVAQFGYLFHSVHQPRSPQIQQRLVRRIERVLILSPADPVFHRQILHGLHNRARCLPPVAPWARSRRITSTAETPAR